MSRLWAPSGGIAQTQDEGKMVTDLLKPIVQILRCYPKMVTLNSFGLGFSDRFAVILSLHM